MDYQLPARYAYRPPTPEQIRNLIDRAEHKGLTPAEAARLREGFGLVKPLLKSNPSALWNQRVYAFRKRVERVYELHNPIVFKDVEICAECSSFNGIRPLGFVAEWPCPTIDAIDGILTRSRRNAA